MEQLGVVWLWLGFIPFIHSYYYLNMLNVSFLPTIERDLVKATLTEIIARSCLLLFWSKNALFYCKQSDQFQNVVYFKHKIIAFQID